MKKSLIYFLSLFVIFPIYALENDDINEDNIIDEIIVSSTKRADEARDVSVTVLALRDADLDRLNNCEFCRVFIIYSLIITLKDPIFP